MASKVSVIRFSFAILEEEAKQIRRAYQSKAISYRELRKWSSGLASTLRDEGYFVDGEDFGDPVWVKEKWEETDFLILENPGRLADRFAEFEIGEERIVPRDWWADNLATQIEARYLSWQSVDETMPCHPFEPTDDQSVIVSHQASPEVLRNIIMWLNEKTKGMSHPNQVLKRRIPEKIFPTRRKYLLALRPGETFALHDSLEKWLKNGVTQDELAAALGAGFVDTLLENYFVVINEQGRMTFNLLMFAATDFCVSMTRERVTSLNSGCPIPLTFVPLIDRLASMLEPKGVPASRESGSQEVIQKVSVKPPMGPRLQFSLEEAEALHGLLSSGEKHSKENAQTKLGSTLYAVLLEQDYLQVDSSCEFVTINRVKLGQTHFVQRRGRMPHCVQVRMFPPSKDNTLSKRLRLLIKAWQTKVAN